MNDARIVLPPGTLLGSYEVVEHLGSGAMGAVYRAFDTKLERSVALKVLHPRTGGEDERDLLLREARSASALNHPNTSTIYEVSEADEQAFIVLEYVEGRTLRDVIPSDGLPIETCIRYGTQIADALAHAHERGVVHRDLKSANVVISLQGEAKVLDFGLAARQHQPDFEDENRSTITMDDSLGVVGTLGYMAPEVLRGAPADARSDVWALGIMLQEAATGRLPFAAKTRAELVSAILRDPPAPMPATVPSSFRTIVGRCLVKEPGRRYQRASEARAALEIIAADALATAPRRRVGATSSGKPRARQARIRSLAVLPLANLSRDAEQEYFADGMTEALISDLAKIGALRVTSRTSAMRYRSSGKSVPEIASELGVDAVVEGSVQRVEDRVRITAQLIDAATDTHLWAESYDRDLSDILALQSEVAKAIVREIRITVTPKERARLASARRVDPEAHEAYLKGRYHWNRRTAPALQQSIAFFERAIARDPTLGVAHAGLASCYVPLAYFGYMSPKEAEAKARSAAQAALKVDDSLAEAHAVMAAVHHDEWDWTAAEKAYRRAIKLNPNYATGHQWFAEHLLDRGSVEEAAAEAQVARRLDPLSLAINALAGYVHYFGTRDYSRTIEIMQKTLELDPNFPTALWLLGLAHAIEGRASDGIPFLESAVRLSGGSRRLQSSLAYVYGLAGRVADAQALLDPLETAARQDADFSYDVALVHLGLGRTDKALAWLDTAFAARSIYLRHLGSDPRWDAVRSAASYRRLLQAVDLDSLPA